MRPRSIPPEAPRDQAETMFTPALRRFLDAEPHVLAIVFVDRDGECVDYCSSLDAFETKVLGAHLQVVFSWVRPAMYKLAAGETTELWIFADQRDVLVRRIDEEYALVVVVRAGRCDESVFRGVEDTVAQLRAEAGLVVPWWESGGGGLTVTVRDAVGWDFAPETIRFDGKTIGVADVIGRWEETGGLVGGNLVCFRVRTSDDMEMTLAYDPRQGRWFRW